jgi:hypothetical protein
MKTLFAFLTFLSILSTSAFASMQDAAIEYFTEFYRTNAESKPDDKIKENVESALEKLIQANRDFMFISAEDRRKIDKEDSAYTAEEFAATLNEFRKLNHQDEESKHILSKLENKEVKGYQQFFYHRYIKHKIQGIQSQQKKVTGDDSGQFSQIIAIYNEKLNSLGKIPSFEELQLPFELKFFSDPQTGKKMNWIYLADANNTGYKAPHPLLAVPIPNSSEKATALRVDGSVGNMYSFRKVSAFNTNKTNIEEALKAVPRIDPAYLNALQNGAKVVINRHLLYRSASTYKKAKSNGIPQLKFKAGEDRYKSSDGFTTHTWVYLGATHKIVHQGNRVICMTETPVIGENHLGFYEDGAYLEITPKQYGVILAKGMYEVFQ